MHSAGQPQHQERKEWDVGEAFAWSQLSREQGLGTRQAPTPLGRTLSPLGGGEQLGESLTLGEGPQIITMAHTHSVKYFTVPSGKERAFL